MDLTRIRIRAEQEGVTLKKICSAIEMSYQNLNRCIKENRISANDLEKISNVLNVPISYFFEEASKGLGNNIIGDHKDSTTISNTGSNININTGNNKGKTKEEVDIEKKELRKNNLFYWTMIESLINNQTGLMVKIVEEAPQLQPFIVKQNETKTFMAQLNTMLKLTDNMILMNENFFDYFENPY